MIYQMKFNTAVHNVILLIRIYRVLNIIVYIALSLQLLEKQNATSRMDVPVSALYVFLFIHIWAQDFAENPMG